MKIRTRFALFSIFLTTLVVVGTSTATPTSAAAARFNTNAWGFHDGGNGSGVAGAFFDMYMDKVTYTSTLEPVKV